MEIYLSIIWFHLTNNLEISGNETNKLTLAKINYLLHFWVNKPAFEKSKVFTLRWIFYFNSHNVEKG